MDQNDPRDPLFKGCTRPAMVFGVPVKPLMIICGPIVLAALLVPGLPVKVFLAVLLIPIFLAMREIAKTDDQQFRLLFLKMRFRIFSYNHNAKFWNASAYSPIPFKKR
jgi:type IV secretion system protein VirB3